jgi:hypothetical protein
LVQLYVARHDSAGIKTLLKLPFDLREWKTADIHGKNTQIKRQTRVLSAQTGASIVGLADGSYSL